MNGAHAVMRALRACGVQACFANPGTSEMHLVSALDDISGIHAVLTLFEGVATGAADGYARMTGRPAATLLHLGPGLANGIANLHNARRARSPVVNIVGDHATYHKRFDAPLDSDIETLACNVSGWLRTTRSSSSVYNDTLDAVMGAIAPPGQVATLIIPADISWSQATTVPHPSPEHTPRRRATTDSIETVAALLRGPDRVALLLGGSALIGEALSCAAAIAHAHEAKLLAETFPPRLERGAGRAAVERISYLGEFATAQLDQVDHLVLVDARAPVSFFAYPNKDSYLVPERCTVHALTTAMDDTAATLATLADLLGASGREVPVETASRPDLPSGSLDARSLAQAIGALLPEEAIVVDEAQTNGIFIPDATAGAPPHDWLTLTGGAIGMGLPVATGAAVACPDRRVVCLEADGSSAYTIQALWTQARENLSVTTVILDNRSYGILGMELARMGIEDAGPVARSMVDIDRPQLDFVDIAHGFGVPALRATTADEFVSCLSTCLASPGPNLIQATLPRSL